MAISINKTSGGGLGINGIIEKYKVKAGNNVKAGDFVQFVSGDGELTVSEDITVVPTTNSNMFATEVLSYLNNRYRALKLTDNKILIVYYDPEILYIYGLVCTMNGHNLSIGTITTISTDNNYAYFCFEVLNENTVILAHNTKISARTGIVLNIQDNEITVNTPVGLSYAAGTAGSSLTKLSNTTVFFCYSGSYDAMPGAGAKLNGQVWSIDGTNITAHTLKTIVNNDSRNFTSYKDTHCIALDNDSVLIYFNYLPSLGGPQYDGIICSIAADNTIGEIGTPTSIISSDDHQIVDLKYLGGNKFIMLELESGVNKVRLRIDEYSNLTITTNLAIQVDDSRHNYNASMDMLSSNRLFLTYASDMYTADGVNDDYDVTGRICNINDVTITLDDKVIYIGQAIDAGSKTYTITNSNDEVFITHQRGGADASNMYDLVANLITKESNIVPVISTLQSIAGVAKSSGTAGQEVDVFVPVVTAPTN